MSVKVKIVANGCYGVLLGGKIVYVANSMTGAIVWALESGYEVEVES